MFTSSSKFARRNSFDASSEASTACGSVATSLISPSSCSSKKTFGAEKKLSRRGKKASRTTQEESKQNIDPESLATIKAIKNAMKNWRSQNDKVHLSELAAALN